MAVYFFETHKDVIELLRNEYISKSTKIINCNFLNNNRISAIYCKRFIFINLEHVWVKRRLSSKCISKTHQTLKKTCQSITTHRSCPGETKNFHLEIAALHHKLPQIQIVTLTSGLKLQFRFFSGKMATFIITIIMVLKSLFIVVLHQ